MYNNKLQAYCGVREPLRTRSLFTWAICGMAITVSRFVELSITTNVVSMSGNNDQRNKSARTNVRT